MGRPLRVYRAAKFPIAYVCVGVANLGTVALMAVSARVDGVPVRVAAFALVLTVMALPVVLMIRSATLIFPDAIAIRGPFRTRRIRWADIATIQAGDSPPVDVVVRIALPGPEPTDRVCVRDRHGKWITLPHLTSRDLRSWGRHMSTELRDLHRWRAVATGTSRRPGKRRP